MVNHTFERVIRKTVAAGLLAAASLVTLSACLSAGPSPEATARLPIEPAATATRVVPTATVDKGATGAATIGSTDLMNALFHYSAQGDTLFNAVSPQAVRLAGLQGDQGLVAPLIDVLRFSFSSESMEAVATSLRQLTGENLGSEFDPWYAWLGRNPDVPVVAGYDRWKGEMLSGIDPGFRRFFYRDVPTRVPLWGAIWGGVRIDGIPPLNDPAFISAIDADYLQDDDVILGVEINGDARAYPHRILAWHEMSNDTIGGRPVTVVY